MVKDYTKFNCEWIKSEAISNEKLKDLNIWRNKLYDIGLIGALDDGIGFGNVSIRSDGNKFIITGSATGGIKSTDGNHYTEVIDFNLEKNKIVCKGPIKASSESLTHAVFYQMNPNINAVIHVHNLDMWKKLINKVPTSSSDVAYGTPEMGREMIRLYNDINLKKIKILVMGGHKEGIVTFGKNLDEAGKIILNYR